MSEDINDHLVLVCGKSATGKSLSLMNLENPEGVMYLGTESGKRLPFRSKFKEYVITDALQVEEAFIAAESMPDIHTIVIDSLTYLLDMFETTYIANSSNGMKGWSDFSQYFKRLMQSHVAKSTKKVVFTAHTLDSLNESEMVMETKVPVKGSLKNQGIESYFSCVIATKKMKLKDLKDYENDLLVISEDDESLGFKYVYQTRLTKETVNERLRGPLGLFDKKETFIDNDIQKVFDRLREYYG